MRVLDPADADDAAAFDALRLEATNADGQPPFSDQSLVEFSSGRRLGVVESIGSRLRTVDAVAVVTDDVEPREAELVVRPSARRRGLGTRLVESLIDGAGSTASADGPGRPGSGELLVWAHGDHPAARVLAKRFGFVAMRELLQLRLLVPDADHGRPRSSAPRPDDPRSPVRIDSFRPGVDDEDWLALNAAAFAHHPEQGRLTQEDLDARRAETWFDPEDFLVAWSPENRMLGFCWLKVEPGIDPSEGSVGEFYAVGVLPTAQGLGLGRSLTAAGLARLSATGIRTASLYVDADNTAAVALYRSMGFETYSIDVQYRRTTG